MHSIQDSKGLRDYVHQCVICVCIVACPCAFFNPGQTVFLLVVIKQLIKNGTNANLFTRICVNVHTVICHYDSKRGDVDKGHIFTTD